MFREVRADHGCPHGLGAARLGDLNDFVYAHALTRWAKYSIESDRKLNAEIGPRGPHSSSRFIFSLQSELKGFG
jgi:hypothetical protein